MNTNEVLEVPPGLAGVAVTTTELGDVRGAEGFYHYRGYSAVELAERRTFEEVWFLVLEGRLPDDAEVARFTAEVGALRELPPAVRAALPAVVEAAPDASPIDLLRTALPLAVTHAGARPLVDIGADARRTDALRVAAFVPALLGTLHRLRHGAEPLAARADLSYAGQYVYQLAGTEPDQGTIRAIEQYLIATIDHGFNASTFTARVVASTGADVGGAVTAALSALTGPRHGGAPSLVLDTLDAIRAAERSTGWIEAEIAAGRRLPGFGHAVYRSEDPRSVLLSGIAERLARTDEQRAFLELARTVESETLRILAAHKPDRSLRTNVEFYAAVVLSLCGIPREMFTPTFAVSRVIGWTANIFWSRLRTVRSFARPPVIWGRRHRGRCRDGSTRAACSLPRRARSPGDVRAASTGRLCTGRPRGRRWSEVVKHEVCRASQTTANRPQYDHAR